MATSFSLETGAKPSSAFRDTPRIHTYRLASRVAAPTEGRPTLHGLRRALQSLLALTPGSFR